MHQTALGSNDETAAGGDRLTAGIVGIHTAEQMDANGDAAARFSNFEAGLEIDRMRVRSSEAARASGAMGSRGDADNLRALLQPYDVPGYAFWRGMILGA